MNKTVKLIIWIVVIAAFLIWGSTQFTTVNTEEQTAVLESEKFDRVVYVDGIWDSQLIPAVRENAADLAMVLNSIDQGLENAGQYANISNSGAYQFRIRGTATVEEVNTATRTGTALIKPDGYEGPIKVTLNIGPSISGEAIRDGSGFITFGNFKDQTEFGQVSRELNKRAGDLVFNAFDWSTMAGKKITFGGMFIILTTNQTNINLSSITISPVYVEAAGG